MKPPVRLFCTIYRTLQRISATFHRVLYDSSYTFTVFGRLSACFVRFIVHFHGFRPPIHVFCTIHRTLSRISATDLRVLYDLSYTFTDFGCLPPRFVRSIVHFHGFRPPDRLFCTIDRTLSRISTARPPVLYDLSYTPTDFDRRSACFVRSIVHFNGFRPPDCLFCTIYRTLSRISAAFHRVLYDRSYTWTGFDRLPPRFVR
jgi:hypothetical protein